MMMSSGFYYIEHSSLSRRFLLQFLASKVERRSSIKPKDADENIAGNYTGIITYGNQIRKYPVFPYDRSKFYS